MPLTDSTDSSAEQWRKDGKARDIILEISKLTVVLLVKKGTSQLTCRAILRLVLKMTSFPDLKTDRAKEWIVKIRRDPGVNFKITKNTKICSVHFNADDYTFREYQITSSKRRLRQTAVPSIFPWTTQVFQRNSITSLLLKVRVMMWQYNVVM